MSDALLEAASRLEEAATAVASLDLSQEQDALSSLLNSIAQSLVSVSTSLTAVAGALTDQEAQQAEAPVVEPGQDAEDETIP